MAAATVGEGTDYADLMYTVGLNDEQYGVGFKLGNEELRDKVEATLLELDADGTFEELSKKYFNGVNVSTLGQ